MTTVLLADDDRSIRDLIILTLRLHQIDVVPTINGEDATLAAQSTQYDVILLDWHMPRLNGLEAAHQIRQTGLNMRTPILFLSGDEQIDFGDLAWAGVLPKPFTLDRLIGRIRAVLGNPCPSLFDDEAR